MPPPVAQIDTEKVYQNEYWTNRYLVAEIPSGPTSTALIDAIVSAERDILQTGVLITRVRHASLAPDDEDYTIRPIGLYGLRTLAAGGLLPLFNVVRIDFTPGAGRPSRKYWRGYLQESDVDNMQILGASITQITGSYITKILAQDDIVDPQGDTLFSGQVISAVGMRQLRRGNRRRGTPVLG